MTGGLILDLIVLILLLLFAAVGAKKGLTVCLVNIFSLIIALVLAFLLCRSVGDVVIKNTSLDDNIQNTIYDNLNVNIGESLDVNNSNLPDNMKNYINETIKNANSTKEEAIQGLSEKITKQVIYVICFIAIFFIVRILLVVVKILSNIINKLPVLSQIDKLGGAICGFLEGAIVIYAALTIISMAAPTINNQKFSSYIEDSYIAKQIYNNNFISKKIFKY